MIVTCEECSTSFQLDEARIPASGAQVRCSRCKHAFFLPNPSASQSEATHSIAETAAGDSMSGVPQAISDAPDAPDATSTAGDDRPDVEPDEENWQFSEEIRYEGDEALEAESEFEDGEDFENITDSDISSDDDVSDELDPGDSMDSTEALGIDDFGSVSDSGLELEATPEPVQPPVESEDEESAFGAAEDFSSLTDEDEVASSDLATDGALEMEPPNSTPEGVGVYSSSGATDDLGDPESWDLVGNHDVAVSKVAIGSIGASTREDAFGSGAASENDSELTEYEEEVGPVSPIWRHLARIGHGVGWTLTIVFVVAAFGVAFQSEWSRLIQTPQTVSTGPMTAQTTTASWVETSRSGYVLVVSGELRNTGSVPLRPGIVQLAMLDAAGHRLDEPPILAGERLPESVLREASPEQLMASSAVAVSILRDTPLAPGERRAFEAIALAADLPKDARRILLEIGDSAAALEPKEVLAASGVLEASRSGQLDEESDSSP